MARARATRTRVGTRAHVAALSRRNISVGSLNRNIGVLRAHRTRGTTGQITAPGSQERTGGGGRTKDAQRITPRILVGYLTVSMTASRPENDQPRRENSSE